MDGEYNFVLTCQEEPKLLCDKTLNHSYLANGKKILAGGSLVFKDGILIEITNNSGHYRPTDAEMLSVIRILYSASRGTLINYISYCTSEPKIYSVAELEYSDKFTSPLVARMKNNTPEIKKNLSATCVESGGVRSTTKLPQDYEGLMDLYMTSDLSRDYDEELVELIMPSRIISGYDEKLVAPDKNRLPALVDGDKPIGKDTFSDRRFGRNLSEDLITKYKEFFGKSTFFSKSVDLIEQNQGSSNALIS
ncbi:hypothetical protein TUM19329_10620 [Legionella antarctica]|uniref:Uncharacterized protein n=1 Tax=Legionella antarctica TaxID=2708020 RepID=A0A6F8T2K7_9GAMM|nr:hypothetical protein [Legionella antarctica]BCA94701.1 hypothetical protein TUM19329_10620 [Legionella antarctica]